MMNQGNFTRKARTRQLIREAEGIGFLEEKDELIIIDRNESAQAQRT